MTVGVGCFVPGREWIKKEAPISSEPLGILCQTTVYFSLKFAPANSAEKGRAWRLNPGQGLVVVKMRAATVFKHVAYDRAVNITAARKLDASIGGIYGSPEAGGAGELN